MPRLPEGVFSKMAYTGRLRPKRVSLFRLQVYESGGILLFEVYERVGISGHLGLLKGPKGLTDEFYGFIKSRKRLIFVIDSQSKDSTFTAVKRNAKF